MKMAVKWPNLFKNGHSIGVLELSFQGDLRFVSLNKYFKLVLAQSGIETAKMNQKIQHLQKFESKISILTLWIIEIYIKVMLIIILRLWGFQNCPWLSEYDKIHGFDSKMKLFFKLRKSQSHKIGPHHFGLKL